MDTVQKSVVLKVDNDAPETVTISSPLNDSAKTLKSAISEDDYSFKVQLQDGKSGMSKLWYIFTNNATAPDFDEILYTSVDVTDGSYNIEKHIDNGRIRDTASTENLCEGEWYLHITAEDKAGSEIKPGNRSSIKTRKFFIL